MGDVCDAVRPGDVEGLTAQPCHDARIDPDLAGILGERDVAQLVIPVLDHPMVSDDAREGLGRQHHGRGVERGLSASCPLPGRGRAEQGVAFNAYDNRDQRAPGRAVEGRSRRVDGDAPVLLPVSSTLPAGLDGDGPLRGDDTFEAAAQGQLVGLDLGDHLIAALTL